MSVVVKLWLTLVVLCPISWLIIKADDGDSILTVIAICEVLAAFTMSLGFVLNLIWSL